MSAKKKATDTRDFDFKSNMESLEKLLEKLENSETPLEESLESFEEAMQLIRRAQAQLTEAERSVQILVDNNDGMRSMPLNSGS